MARSVDPSAPETITSVFLLRRSPRSVLARSLPGRSTRSCFGRRATLAGLRGWAIVCVWVGADAVGAAILGAAVLGAAVFGAAGGAACASAPTMRHPIRAAASTRDQRRKRSTHLAG